MMGEIDRGLQYGPVVIEELSPFATGPGNYWIYEDYMRQSRERASGWMQFYWGSTIPELRERGEGALAHWIEDFVYFGQTLAIDVPRGLLLHKK
jgi:hypothetical protein